MPSYADVTIETDRLRLAATHERFAPEVFPNFTAEITTFMFPAPAKTIDETEDFLRSARAATAAGEELQVVVLHGQTGELLGHGGLHNLDSRSPELGIWIKKSAHGNGYGMEAVAGLADWACANLKFDYLVCPVDRRNVPSRRIPEALGGVVAAEYTQTNASGNLLDLLEYRIDRRVLAARHGRPYE